MFAHCITPLVLAALSTASFAVAGAAPPGAEAAAAQSETVSSPGSDWDWGAFTGLDDAPVTRKPSGARKAVVGEPGQPRAAENAVPDFAASPRVAYALFKGAPSFEVIPSQRDGEMHPCSNCHQWVLSDPRPRNLKEPHDNFVLKHGLHGKGKFWCFTCHDLSGRGGLKTLEGEKLDFGDAYILCSQCHSDQARDWVYGAHGKRVSGWQGKRQVLNCTACHYQHRPAFQPRAPKAGPVIRKGLTRPAHWVARDGQRARTHGYEGLWNNAHGGKDASAAEQPAGGEGESGGRAIDERS